MQRFLIDYAISCGCDIQKPCKILFTKYSAALEGRWGGGCAGFQVTGIINRFFWGLKFLILGFFWVGKFGKYFLGWLDK